MVNETFQCRFLAGGYPLTSKQSPENSELGVDYSDVIEHLELWRAVLRDNPVPSHCIGKEDGAAFSEISRAVDDLRHRQAKSLSQKT